MKSKQNAFTLVELLAVIAVIALIVAILIPGLSNALERSRQVKCKSNLRNIGIAMIAFADDHDGHLPGACYRDSSLENWQKPFMGREVLQGQASLGFMPDANHIGTLLSYLPVSLDNARTIYRCPSHKENADAQEGSNGMFDYAMMSSLAGAPLDRISPKTTIYPNQNEKRRVIATPLIVEESPTTLNSPNPAPCFKGEDHFGSWHKGDIGFFCAVDGSVGKMETNPDGLTPTANDCEMEVNREWYSIGLPATDFGGADAFGLLPWDVQ